MASMRTIGVRLRLLVGDYKRDADEAAKTTDKLGDSITKAGNKSKADFDKIAMGAGIAGAALLGIAGAAVVAAAGFDKQMSEVGAVAGATADEMDQLRQAAVDAGAATVFSAKEAAEAEAELAKAGISTSDILGGALAGSLSLASAGSLDLATSAEIAAAAMNTFGLGGGDVSHIADVLAAAANKSAAGVDDLGQGLQQVGLVAAQVGLSFEETVAVLAAFADRGLKGSDGATSLKTALQRLAAPTVEAKSAMDSLGISMYDASGNMVDITDVAGQLQRGLKDLAPAQRNAALQTIFGSDAIRAANILYGEGEAGIREYINVVDDQGAAARMAAGKLDNLSGDVDALTGSLETLFIQSGEGANGGLRVLAQGATEVVNSIAALPAPVQTAGVVLAGMTGIGLITTAGFLKLRSAIDDMAKNLTAIGPGGAKAGKALQSVAAFAGRASVALAGVGIAGRAISLLGDDVSADVTSLSGALAKFAQTGEASGEAARLFGNNMEDLRYDLQSFDSGTLAQIGKGFAGAMEFIAGGGPGSRSLEKATERMQALDQALADLVTSGHADQAGVAFARIAAVAAEEGISVDDVSKGLGKYKSALDAAGPSAVAQAAAATQTTKANIELAGAFGAAASEVEGLTKAFHTNNDAMLGWRGAERDAEAAVDTLAEALKDSNGSLDVHDEKGRAAAAAVDALAEAAATAAQKNYDQTHSVEAANAVYQNYVGQLRQTLLNAGIAAEQVDALVASITKMPTYKAVTIDVVETTRSYWQDYRAGERRRWGGITDHSDPLIHAATGVLSQASMFSAGPTRYAFAEPQTGGEAFVPKRGNYGRSMSILSAAAGWYNADVVPKGGWYGGNQGDNGGVQRVEVAVSAAPGSNSGVMREIVNGLTFETRTKGRGDITKLINPRRGR